MDVFSRYFSRLVHSSAGHIFPGRAAEQPGAYAVLVSEVQKIRHDPQQAYKIAESLDAADGETFRDFDLSTFMAHFKLGAVPKTTLALACKSAIKPDLRTKGSLSPASVPARRSTDSHQPMLSSRTSIQTC